MVKHLLRVGYWLSFAALLAVHGFVAWIMWGYAGQ